MPTYALIELDHADFGPLFDTRQEAEAALSRLATMLPEEADRFGVFELNERGYPVDPDPR